MSWKKVLLVAWVHFVLSMLVMDLCLYLAVGPPRPFLDAVSAVLGWIFCFPAEVIVNLTGCSTGSGLLLLFVNTFFWCLIVIPIVAAVRYILRAYLLR